jgi:DNA polymerase-4
MRPSWTSPERSGCTATPPAVMLAQLVRRMKEELGLTGSIGLSHNKFLAKIASDLDKPRGFSVIGKQEALDFLRPRPVTLIWGVGKAFAAALERDGIRTIGQLQGMEEPVLMRRYGVMGKRLFHLARGEDERTVHANEGAKSVSAETTFNSDLSEAKDLVPVLRRLSEKVSARLKASGIAGQTVVLKLKTADFKSRTRNLKLEDPTVLADKIFRTGLHLLGRELGNDRFRLIGIGVSDLTDAALADPPDLVDPAAARRAVAESAIDKVRQKFGRDIVETGYTFGTSRKMKQADQD